MLYHVIIETDEKVGKQKKNKQIIVYDINSKETIIDDYAIPYLANTEFYANGFILQRLNITRFLVKESKRTAEHMANSWNQRPSAPGIFRILTTKKDVLFFAELTNDITKDVLLSAKEKLQEPRDTNVLHEASKMKYDQVFIVHGHDEAAKLSISEFLSKLDLDPIILSEQASQGNTIIEKFEEHSGVGYAIVLYTPCDVGGKSSDSLQARARQNVIFEHGYLIAKLGRERVCALIKGSIEKPTDISGIVYVKLDDAGGWKIKVAQELRAAGFSIDLNKVIN